MSKLTLFDPLTMREASPHKQGKFRQEFGYYFNDNGGREFGVIGEKNVFENVQRSKSNCDYTIFKNFLLSQGMKGLLNTDPKDYGFSPARFQDELDAVDFYDSLNSVYNKLPAVIRAKYKSIQEVINSNDADVKALFDSLKDNKSNSQNSANLNSEPEEKEQINE